MVLFPIATVIACVAAVSEAAGSSYKLYSQESNDQFNLLKHGGGAGPYAVHSGWGISTDTPEQCVIEQAHLYVRHGERYPTKKKAKTIRKIFDQISEKGLVASNKAYFLNTYKSPSIYDTEKFDLETTQGPYNGYSSMYQAGAQFRERYNDLYQEGNTLPFFTASENRVIVTSINVARGFFGANWTDHSQFVVLNETEEMGLNSLTPKEGCPKYSGKLSDSKMSEYATVAFDRSAKKLVADVPGLELNGENFADLMELCMYDLNVQGFSPLCDYFSQDDWVAFDHYRNLKSYYKNGRGNPTIPALGGVHSDAIIKLLESPASPANGTALYLNFLHDSNVLALIAALGIATPAEPLSTSQADFTSRLSTSQLAPMGLRVAIEKLSCQNSTDESVTEDFIRFVINDAVFPHDKCTSGPGFSCPLDEYIKITKKRYPDAIKKCGIDKDYSYPKELTFYWDWQSRPEYYQLPSDVDVKNF